MKNTAASIAANIAARKALGMTADEYSRHQAQLAADLRQAQRLAIADAVRAGMRGNAAEIDAAVRRCQDLGVATGPAIIGGRMLNAADAMAYKAAQQGINV